MAKVFSASKLKIMSPNSYSNLGTPQFTAYNGTQQLTTIESKKKRRKKSKRRKMNQLSHKKLFDFSQDNNNVNPGTRVSLIQGSLLDQKGESQSPKFTEPPKFVHNVPRSTLAKLRPIKKVINAFE